VAILEDERLVELFVDHPDRRRIVGDIYLGKVEAVLPGIQAAFVDIGLEKSAFLHASDLIEPDEDDEDDAEENGAAPRSRRRLPNVSDHLKRGQTLLVQVTKEAIGTKGPRVTAQVSLPGRFLVFIPNASRVGVSRKIDDREERARLRQMVADLLPKDVGGVIVRTVAEDLTSESCRRELQTLRAQWKRIKRKATFLRAPSLAHREASLTRGLIRDVFSDKVDALQVDSKELHREIVEYVKEVDPSLVPRVSHYTGEQPLFDAMDIEAEIRELFSRRVELPTGGHLIIEPTEALVSIDVNTGRYTGKKDAEATILRTNLEAAREIARQLRLRDIGGIIVIDFIDMDERASRDRVLQELRTHLSRDRARTRAFAISDLGLVEMTRQRVRPSLWQSLTTNCPSCSGVGRVFRPEVVARRLERALRRAAAGSSAGDGNRRLAVRLHPEVALYLLEQEPEFLKQMAKETRLDLELRDDPMLLVDEFRLMAQPAGRDVTERYAVA